jgi:hypothetical protein
VKKNIHYLGGMLVMLFITACGSSPADISELTLAQAAKNRSLELLAQITIPAKQNRAYLQNGAAVAHTSVNLLQPYCELELKNKTKQNTHLNRLSFEIFGIHLEKEILIEGTNRSAGSIGDAVLFSTQLFLKSNKDTDVVRLNCAKTDAQFVQGFMSMEEFKQTVGAIIKLK